jgi:hypothetical protein
MARTLTGANGALVFQGRKVAKVRQFDLSLSVDALEDTCVGQRSRTYVPGLFGANGSATVLLDTDDDAGSDMLNTIFNPATGTSFEFYLDEQGGKSLRATGFLTGVSPSVSVGEVQAASVSFQLSGDVQGGF